MFKSFKFLPTAIAFGVAAVVSVAGTASAQTLIGAGVQNGSFETETAKTTDWADVAFWSLWDAAAGGPFATTNSDDSGTDESGFATAGDRVAFLQTNNAAYNATSHVVQIGDVFAYTWDWVQPGRSNATAGLAYQSAAGVYTAIAATDSTNPDTDEVHNLGGTYTAMVGDAAIGNVIALTIQSPDGNYPEVDNFVLTANAVAGVPEPGSLAFLLLTGAAVAVRRRRS